MNEEYYRYDHEQHTGQDDSLVDVRQNNGADAAGQDGVYRYKRVDNGAIPQEPVKKVKKPKQPGQKGSFWKRGLAFAMAGILFGTAAGGTFVGVTYLAQKKGVIASTDEEVLAQNQQTETEADNETQQAVGRLPVENAYQSNGNGALMDVSGVVDQVMPSVVAITNTQLYENYGNYFDYFQYFFGGGSRPNGGQSDSEPQEIEAGSGSGIIVGENDTEFLIVTNQHVIEGANSLTITFADDSTAKANVKGSDSDADLAVVAVAKSDLTAETLKAIRVARLGDSDDLKAGQGVIAIGNAMGFGQSVTVGYISALNRQVTTSDQITRTLLQTDAAINPGNSGGALVNLDGEIIGINSAKYKDTAVEGIGYAIPVSAVKDIIDDLMGRKTRVEVAEEERGYLGIQAATVDENTAANLGMPKGVYVYSILENGAAAGADLAEKDIITYLDGQRLNNHEELIKLLQYYSKGDTVELTIQRLENGEYVEKKIEVVLGGAAEDNAEE